MRKNLQQLFQDFIYECEFIQKLRPDTILGYNRTFKTFQILCPNTTLEMISAPVVTDFFKTLQVRKRIVGRSTVKVGIKKSTAASYWSKLNVFFDWLEKKGHIPENPFKKMKYPKPVYEDLKYLNKEEIERILTVIHMHHNGNILLLKRNLVLLYLLLFCGLRKEELMHLQIRDIDFEKKLLTIRPEISKSGRSRQLPLHGSLLMHLIDYLKERQNYSTPYLIVSNNADCKLSYAGLKHLVTKIREASGIAFHLHQFRHTFAVNFLKTSNNIFKLKTLLGHTDIRSTTFYLRCLPCDELRGDVEGMSIDNFL